MTTPSPDFDVEKLVHGEHVDKDFIEVKHMMKKAKFTIGIVEDEGLKSALGRSLAFNQNAR
jgi:hypothetical protein